MREYLKAIGFSDLNSRKKTDELINEIKKNPSRKNWFQIDEEEAIFIYEKDFAEAVGIAVIEVMDRDGYRVTDHFYPYVRGANYLYHEDLEFEHYTDKEGYAGICDENNIGIPLIFHIIKQLEYFRAIVDAGTISGAARNLHMTQPPLSYQIKMLEEELGVKLFVRGAKNITLTEAGKALYIRAGSLLTMADITKREVIKANEAATIHFGLAPSTVSLMA